MYNVPAAAEVLPFAVCSYDAFYKLTDSRQQITAYVFDVVRGSVPQMDLDEIYVVRCCLPTLRDSPALPCYCTPPALLQRSLLHSAHGSVVVHQRSC